ncbi:MAG: hydroxyisourate hydrolase [Pseudomonadota bacterium]
MAEGFLTTHVLDVAHGRPAAGLKVALYRIENGARALLVEKTTNADGRTDGPILPVENFETGWYELVFFAGDYLRSSGSIEGKPPFLDQVPIRFGMAETDHYHVPLLLSPYGYSTYRGS